MAYQFKNNLNDGVNLDLALIRMPPNAAIFLKNLTQNLNINSGTPGGSGQDSKVTTPLEGNQALAIPPVMPLSPNYCIGFYSAEQTNEGYFFVYNDNVAQNHTVWVISGDTGVVRKVHESSLLPFVLDPAHFFAEGRVTLELKSIIDPVTNLETNFKLLIFTNNNKYQVILDVEASIATNSYTTSYFTASASFYNPIELIHLSPTLPIKCVNINNPNAYVPVTDATIIDTMSIDAPGINYMADDVVDISGGSGGQIQVTAVNSTGGVVGYNIIDGGTTYTITGSPVATSGGSGSGLTLTILALITPDSSKQNQVINAGFQFRIRTWDVWGRPSEWGIISAVATALIGGGCISTSNGLPRCFNLCFDAGNPLIKFIDVAYRRGVGNDPTGQTETGWLITETFRKYDDSTNVEWYNRPYNPVFTTANSGITFNAGTNIITYTFCADKGSNPVDPTEAARTEPGIPISSGTVGSVNKAVLLANNLYDFEVPSQSVVDAVQFFVQTPNPATSAVPCPAADLRTITLFANIYNAYGDFAEEPLIKVSYGYVSFGADSADISPGTATCDESAFSMDQVFGDQTNPGFIAYLAGTPFAVIGVWGDYDPSTGIFTPQPTFADTGMPHLKMVKFTFVDVPAGKYLVRLSSHHSKITDGNLQQTSTTVAATCPIGYAQIAWARRLAMFESPYKEIEVDCSSADVNLGALTDPMFIILDLGNGLKSNAVDGYLKESAGGASIEMAVCFFHGSTMGTVGDAYGSWFTDHNGYFFMTSGSSYAGMTIYMNLCSPNVNVPVFAQTSGCGGSTGKFAHGYGLGTGDFWGNFGNWYNEVYVVGNPLTPITSFPAAARRVINQTFTVCGQPTIGIPGIPVILTKCQPALTDSSGLATLIAHNRYNYLSVVSPTMAPFGASSLPDFSSLPYNVDYLIFSQKGGCEWNACGTCNTSMADVVVYYIPCGGSSVGCTGTPPPRSTCLTNISAQPNGVGISGIQSGGKYPVAFVLHNVVGKHTSPQIRMGDAGYVFVPNLNDTAPSPYPSMALCSLGVTIPAGLTVSDEFTHITFWVGSNCLFDDFFTWPADWVQYVDNTGTTNTTNPTAIRIYFSSLNEYNKQYNFGTNVAWDFIAADSENVSEGLSADVAQFIMNGDGTWLAPQKGATITYDTMGAFFTVDYTPELAGLINGCLFKIVRPKANTSATQAPYYEQCLTLSITNGVLPAGTWTLPYQDSYLLSRSIPVPILAAIVNSGTLGTPATVPLNSQIAGASTGLSGVAVELAAGVPGVPNSYQIIGDQGGPVAPGATPPYPLSYTSTNNNQNAQVVFAGTNDNVNGVVNFSQKVAATTFPFFFESPSPSDLWGSHLASKGRVDIPNPYEIRFRIGTEIAVSNPLADKGIVNGIGTYLDVNKQTFDRNTYGDITVVLAQQGVLMVICNNDYFITRYNQTQLRVVDGSVQAQNSSGQIFTAPETKVGSNYGVIAANINTIVCYNGMVAFLDNKGHVIFSNFSDAKPVEKEGYQAYLLQKIANVNILNQDQAANGITYWHGQFDIKTMEYFLTNFNIPTADNPSYINTESEPTLGVSETMLFDLASGMLKGFASFTPEYYGRMPGFFTQRQFLSFKNAIPYIHHGNFDGVIAPPAYCNFYGTQCEVRVTHVINQADKGLLPDKVKRFLYNEVYCRSWIPGATGAFPSALFYADEITTEKGQESRLLPARWVFRDGFWSAEFLCDLNTPPDPNQPIQTGANALLDGNPLQGRWCMVSLTNNSLWTGVYFELSEIVSYFNLLEKSAD